MKPTFPMKRAFLSLALVAFLMSASVQSSSASENNDAIVHSVGNVSYVSGGVGTESIDRLNSLAGEFNLKLVFAMKSGEYVSGVRVVIASAKEAPLLDSTSEGPWFMVKLPSGNYQIVATLAGKTMNRQIAINSEKLRTIDFRWGAE